MRFCVLAPDPTTNYITNPSLRYDTTDWNANGATLTRSLEEARFGIASLQVVTAGTVLNEGAFFRVSALAGISESVTVSAYVRGTGRVRIRLDDNSLGGREYPSQPVDLRDDRWIRISASGFSTGGNDLRLYVETAEGTARARTFYVDGAQLERKSYPTTYCDGDQPDCRWDTLAHASTSSRDETTRAGGRWVQLAGAEREEKNLYMTAVGGLGMAHTSTMIDSFTVQPGGYLKSRKTPDRLISLVFHAKNPDGSAPVSLKALHELRQTLIDILNPHLDENADIWFEYADGDRALHFQARYDGGLEGDWDIRNQFVASFPLRLLAVSPFITDDNQDAQVLDFQDSTSFARRVLGRIDGRWSHMNYGLNGAPTDLELGPRGELVAGGVFSFVNFNVQAVDPFRQTINITYFDGEKWNRLAGSMTGVAVNDVAVAPNGDLYVTGLFSAIDGVPANNIARWNGTSWSALGSGLNLDGIHVSIDNNGRLYVGGRFTTAGGVSANGIAFWDGSSWHGMGQYSGFDARVNSIAITPDGNKVYVGGWFVYENGVPAVPFLRVALYDPETDRFSPVGAGFDDDVREVLLGEGEVLYACGDFIYSGTTLVNRIAKFEGGAWQPLGDGMDDNVLSFDIGKNGDMIAVGDFARAS